MASCHKQRFEQRPENRFIPGKIVYAYEYNNINVITPDGIQNQVTSGKLDYLSWRYSPWSPNAEWIAFQRMDTATMQDDICIIRYDGTGFMYLKST